MRLRYPDVALQAAHYESVYSMLVHPGEARALWVRTTVQKRPGQRASGALWVTWFTGQGVRAGKLNDLPVAPGGHGIVAGEATQGPAGSRGRIALPGLAASWDVTFAPRTGPLEHLAPAVLYRAPLPRTKATSPVPDLDANGTLTVDGEAIDLSGWTGMLGHNWGTEHAARWIWLRAAGLGANGQGEGDGWLDAILARVRLGPVLAPWTGFGTLFLDGKRHRLGGLPGRGTKVALRPDGADITLAGRGATVITRATVAPASTVGWAYSDPSGRRHEVVNSSVATMSLAVVGRGRHLELTPVRRGVLEVGGDERAFDVPLQPVPD
jgi:hypothetical protein